MGKFLLAGLAISVAVGCSGRSNVTDPEARAIIEKAIQAQGGEEKLAQFKAGQWKGRGVLSMNGQNLPMTVETVFQIPDKYKSAMRFIVQGKEVAGVQVVDGDKAWMTGQGQTMPLEGELLKALKEELYSQNVEMLVPLLREKGYTLTKLKEIEVDGKPAVGVRVASSGHKDIELYFDRDSTLPVRTVRSTIDAATLKEATAEVLYSSIKETDGIKWPSRVVINQDGKKFIEVEVTEFKKLDKVDPSEFAKPR